MRFLKLAAAMITVSQLALASTPAAPAQRAGLRPPAATDHRTRPQTPATAARGCDLATMPALPSDADRTMPARNGFEWTPGHYRCTRSGWSYQTGYWRRAGTIAPAGVFVVARNGGVSPRPGYEFVRQGEDFFVALRRANGRAAATGIRGKFDCTCSGSGGCALAPVESALVCMPRQSCTDGCRMSIVILGDAGVAISRRDELPVFLRRECGAASGHVVATS